MNDEKPDKQAYVQPQLQRQQRVEEVAAGTNPAILSGPLPPP